MEDMISRKMAIDALKHNQDVYSHNFHDDPIDKYTTAIIATDIETIVNLPSAQPETHEERTETHTCDLISRQAAMEEISKQHTYKMFEGEDTLYLDANDVGSVLASLPSAQPETSLMTVKVSIEPEEIERVVRKIKDAPVMVLPYAQPEHTNSWCIDCKEYDTENKCCPRYNRVIKQTLDDAYRHGETESEARFHAQQRWIPCSEMLPEERQEILATTTDNAWGDVVIIRTYYKEMHKSVIAWMPLPEPYREEGE